MTFVVDPAVAPTVEAVFGPKVWQSLDFAVAEDIAAMRVEIERLRAENEDLYEAFQDILNIGIRVGNTALKRDDQK
jgi:uncharacterized small protein (DUF1192 family)